MATITIIVPAAGCGARAALNGNKILAPLRDERSVLFWTLNALYATDLHENEWREIIVAARRDEFRFVDEIKKQCAFSVEFEIVEGGATRQQSVHNAVKSARGDFVLVHDAARPCVSPSVVKRVVDEALKTGGAIAAMPASDTIKRADANGKIAQTLDRRTIWLAQTPQVFRRQLFLDALEQAQRDGFEATDCASILEHAGHTVSLVEGETDNIKVTFAADLERAAAILSANKFAARKQNLPAQVRPGD